VHEDEEDSVRDVVDTQFYKHLAKTAVFNMGRMWAIPVIRVGTALCGAFMLHWLAGLGYMVFGVLVFYKLPNMLKGTWNPDGLDESKPTPTESADKLDAEIKNISGVPKGFMPKVSLLIGSTFCGVCGWLLTANGGVAALLFVLALLSPVVNARIVRRYLKDYSSIVRFMDPTRRPDTPEI
jgi:hypothetical protein